MKVDMSDQQHLWVQLDPRIDRSEVIIDKEQGDIRICDGHNIVKVTFDRTSRKINAVLVDDIFVWQGK